LATHKRPPEFHRFHRGTAQHFHSLGVVVIVEIKQCRVAVCIVDREAVTVFQTTVCKKIVEALERSSCDKKMRQHIEVISQDCFYKELSAQQKQLAIKGQMNFDHPGTV